MAEIIPFPLPLRADPDEAPAIDVMTALDLAIRDLREIAERSRGDTRRQAEDCQAMLERAYLTALL